MRFVNPYNDVQFGITPRVMSDSHQHIYDANLFRWAWRMGVRIFACVNYYPSSPSVSTKHLNSDGEMSNFSNWKLPVKDWTNTDIPENATILPEEDKEQYLTTRYYEGSVPSIVWDGQTINTKLVPQIANAEHAFHKITAGANDVECTHHNILGNLFGEPTNGYDGTKMTNELYPGWDVNNQFVNIGQERTWRHNNMTYTLDDVVEKYLDSNNQQFGGKIFGTVNHSYNEDVEVYFDRYPQVFKALELFNQYMSPAYNSNMRNRYDALLRKGYRIYGVAVVDWTNSIERWSGLTPEEQVWWTAQWNALTPEQKSQYDNSLDTYYNTTAIKETKVNRGFNMLYIDDYDESLITTLEKAMQVAEKGLDAYIAGRYYMSGTGVNSIVSISIENETVSIEVTGNPTSIIAITSQRTITGSGNTMNVLILPGETYIRFEVYYYNQPEGWDEMTYDEQEVFTKQGVMDFLFTNPIWIEDNDAPVSDDNLTIKKAIKIGVI